MPRIRIYTTRWCGFCVRAKTLLDSRGLAYEEISLDDDPAFRQTVLDATGGWTVPQILIECAGSAAGEAGDAPRKTPGAQGTRSLPIGSHRLPSAPGVFRGASPASPAALPAHSMRIWGTVQPPVASSTVCRKAGSSSSEISS